MTNVKKKNMVAFIATAVLYLVFLLTNFSTLGCIISAFSLLYLFLSTCVSKRAAKADYGIIDNIGQNAFEQARQFTQATQVTSLAITKLDGTAKGGVASPLTLSLRMR